MKNAKMQSRRAFTLLELIFVTIVIVGLMAIAVSKIISNSKSAQETNVVTNDVSQIVKAAGKWRNDDASSDGTFSNITTSGLCPYLPRSMACETISGTTYITSSGYHNSSGYGRIKYEVGPSKISTNGDSIKIFADATDLANAQHWESRQKQKFETIFINACKKASSQPNNVAIDKDAVSISKTTGGTTTDAKAMVEKIAQ